MKILQIAFSLSSGGAEKFIVNLSNELSKKNDVYLIVIQKEEGNLSFFKSQINNKVNYTNLNCSKGINLKTFFSIFKLIKKIKPNTIHFHLNTILYLYLPALLFKKNIVFIHTLHSIPSKTIGFKWQKIINKYFYKNKVIQPVVISNENKKLFNSFYNIDSVKIVDNGVPYAVKSDKFKSVKEELEGLKNNSNDKIYIHIGRFNKAKNQKLLITVFNRLIEEDNSLILIIIGDYFNQYPGNELKKISKEGIYYLGTKTNVSDYLLNSDAFVLSSLWEGLPISLLEAISCGVIPVCTPAGGIPDVIKDDRLGCLSVDFSEQSFYNSVKKSIDNMEYFDRENLINYYNAHFSMEKCAKEYQLIYNN